MTWQRGIPDQPIRGGDLFELQLLPHVLDPCCPGCRCSKADRSSLESYRDRRFAARQSAGKEIGGKRVPTRVVPAVRRQLAFDAAEHDDPAANRPLIRPSRLHRPAAWMIDSSGASSRIRNGKSTSTPASISCVLTRKQGEPPLRRSPNVASFSRRCSGHIAVDRWKMRRSTGPSVLRRSHVLLSSCSRHKVRTIRSACARRHQTRSAAVVGFGPAQADPAELPERLRSSGMISRASRRSCRLQCRVIERGLRRGA